MQPTFFERLESDSEFTSNLGVLVCATSRFEDALDQYVPIADRSKKLPLSVLIKRLKEAKYIGDTLDFHIGFAVNQRNYFVHNLYRRLKKYSAGDLNAEQFKNRVQHLAEEFRFFTNLLNDEVNVVLQNPEAQSSEIRPTTGRLTPKISITSTFPSAVKRALASGA